MVYSKRQPVEPTLVVDSDYDGLQKITSYKMSTDRSLPSNRQSSVLYSFLMDPYIKLTLLPIDGFALVTF